MLKSLFKPGKSYQLMNSKNKRANNFPSGTLLQDPTWQVFQQVHLNVNVGRKKNHNLWRMVFQACSFRCCVHRDTHTLIQTTTHTHTGWHKPDIHKRHQPCLKVPWHEHFTLGGYLTLMSSPSLPLSPQWLDILISVNQALGILPAFEKMKAQTLQFEIGRASCRERV